MSGKQPSTAPSPISFAEAANRLADLGRELYAHDWVLGTSGNFSVVLEREPLRLAVTATQLDKGLLTPDQILEVDAEAHPVHGTGIPSNETLLHMAVVRACGAGAVLHTHSVWSTILSEAHAASGGLGLENFEMLKGLENVKSHEHHEWIPILENTQDIPALARDVERMIGAHPDLHGFLLRRHGLYTWGQDLAAAKRHIEILEFLLEVAGREHCAGGKGVPHHAEPEALARQLEE